MKVLGALESAQIEWFTDAGKPAASSYPYRVIYVTDLKQIQVSDGTNWNPTAIRTYTVATLPAAAASNQNQLAFITDTLQVKVSNGTEWKTIGARLDTYTSGTIPAAASNTNSIIWVSDLQQVQVSNGSAWIQVGSKAGAKNYFSESNANPDFETNSVSPWSACTLTFSSGVPSGAPTLTATQMSISTTSTNPLSGTYSMLLTKAAANAQYQGFISGALTVDREDTAKVLYGSFFYEVTSGTVDFSGSSTQTYEIWIYNTVSGTWTQPAGYRGMNQSSGVGQVVFSFQTDGTFANNAYKIAVITQQTGTGAITVKFDDFVIGPRAIVLGSAMTDWQSYTPTFTGFGTASNIEFQWRRIGDSVQVKGKFTAGTPTATEARISLPSGMTSADTSKIPTLQQAGTVAISTNSATSYYSLIEPSVTYLTFGFQNSTNNALTKANGSTFTTASTVNSVLAQVPIQGWGSFSQVSSDTDTRVVAFAGTVTNTSFGISSTTTLSLSSETDTHGGLTSATTYTIPVSGVYRLSMSGYINTGSGTASDRRLNIKVDGVTVNTVYQTSTNLSSITPSAVKYLNAGQAITWEYSNGGVAVSTVSLRAGVERLAGPSVVTATETVAWHYQNTAGTSITTSSAQVPFATKTFDTHSMVSSNVATIPTSGTYLINAKVTNTTANYSLSCDIRVNGSSVANGRAQVTASPTVCANTYLVKLNAGDTVDIIANSSTNTTLATSAGNNIFTGVRVGN